MNDISQILHSTMVAMILSYGSIVNLRWIEHNHTPWKQKKSISNIASSNGDRPMMNEGTTSLLLSGTAVKNATWQHNEDSAAATASMSELSTLCSMDSGILASVESLAASLSN